MTYADNVRKNEIEQDKGLSKMHALLDIVKKKKAVFITGTGTDIGKTYVTALLAKYYKEQGIDVAYYKAAISGADTIPESDAGYVKKIAGLEQPDDSMVSYLFSEAVSPHLAAKINNRPIDLKKVVADYQAVRDSHAFTVVEGSGGIVCPIRYDEDEKILLPDVVKALGLSVLVVADAGLGTIHNVVTTIAYIRSLGIEIEGILLNHYIGTPLPALPKETNNVSGCSHTAGIGSPEMILPERKLETFMQEDNYRMIEELTGVSIVATISPDSDRLELTEN